MTEDIEQRLQARRAMRIMRGAKESVGTKNGAVYVLLAFFACTIGLHNFYAGYIKKGIIQLLLTIVSPLFMFLPLLAVSVWGLLEMLLVNKSANGKVFVGNKALILILKIVCLTTLVYALQNNELFF